MTKKLFVLSAILLSSIFASSQCDPGYTEVYIVAYSYDVWGEESYWELVPNGAGCGNNTLLSGGSEEVGCAGNGPTGENGIPDFGNEIIGPYCLTTGELYDLVWVDWYGDGGLAFDVIQDGILTNMYIGGGAGNTWTFEAGASTLPAYDSPCGATEILPDINTATFITSQCIASFSEIRPPAGSCATYGMWCENGISNSAWAYFIAEEGKAYEISACNSGSSFDTQIAVWHGSDCIDPWSFELVTANDDGWNGCGEANGYTSTCYASCLEPGDVYYIQVDGWNGENGTAVISVNSYLGDEILSAQVNDINCPLNKGQAPNGSIFPSIVGTGADFECYWEGPDGFESDDHFVYNLGPGEYQLTATTNCGTVYEGTYSIGLPDQWNVTTSVTPSSCPDAEDGSIEIIASGATPGYSYAINGPNGYSSNSSFVDNAYLGNYNVTVTDANGCTFTQTVSVSTEDDLSFDLGPDTTLCLGEETLIYGPPGLNYLWNDGSQNQFFEIVTNDWGVGTHALILTASTETGCTHTDAFIFNVELCPGVGEINSDQLQVFPNPSHGQFNIRLVSPGTVEIFDATGRLVQRETTTAVFQTIGVELAPGTYFIKSSAGEVVMVVCGY